MNNLISSRLLHLPERGYRIALVAFGVVAALVMMMTSAAGYASTPTAPTLTGFTTRVGVVPYSASGCNQSVCISVVGTGLYVNYVNATGTSTSRNGCVKGQMLVRGSVRLQTNTVCWLNPPNSIEHLTAHYSIGYNINNGSQVCVKFIGLGAPKGLPCETIHS